MERIDGPRRWLKMGWRRLCGRGAQFPSLSSAKSGTFCAAAPRNQARQMAAHESARTTGLYDRRSDEVSLDEVERIGI
jgi:hypothetical protein